MGFFQVKNTVAQLSLAILALSTMAATLRNVEAKESSAVGVYTGSFKQTTEQLQAQKAYKHYFRKQYGVRDDICCGANENVLARFPKHIRPLLYKDPMFGYYQLINPTHLTLIVDELRDDNSFVGRSLAAGNERQVTGVWRMSPKGYLFDLAEPVDQKHDGKFTATLNTKNNSLSGRWIPYEASDNAKDFTLHKTVFKYNPEAEAYYLTENNPSLSLLKTSDVENLSKQEIRHVRNLIYARHGYAFSKLETRQQFEMFEWYVPLKTNVDDELTEIEKQNIAILNRYESYAEERYTSFGR